MNRLDIRGVISIITGIMVGTPLVFAGGDQPYEEAQEPPRVSVPPEETDLQRAKRVNEWLDEQAKQIAGRSSSGSLTSSPGLRPQPSPDHRVRSPSPQSPQ